MKEHASDRPLLICGRRPAFNILFHGEKERAQSPHELVVPGYWRECSRVHIHIHVLRMSGLSLYEAPHDFNYTNLVFITTIPTLLPLPLYSLEPEPENKGVHLILCFLQELSIFCDLSFASTGLLLAVQKWSTNKSDCTLGSLARTSCSSTWGWVAVNWEKTQFLIHPVDSQIVIL